ncbi:Ni/Fe hydrogenase subunit alpha [Nitrospirota bacterium]
MKINVNIKHLTRVEGHGNINIKIVDGKLKEASWNVVETPRFFETMLKGKNWDNVPWICARICGICSIGHTLGSIRAIERAFGVEPPEYIHKFRLLLKHMETLQSHILHLYFLSAPDFLNQDSVFPLIESAPEVVARAAKIKLLANDVCDCIGGRRLHPTRTVVGGFTMLPEKYELEGLMKRLEEISLDLEQTVELFRTFNIPEFIRETEYVSLKGEGEYPFIGGNIISSDDILAKEDDYLAMTNEFTVENSTAKWCRLSRESFAVGALARINNNSSLLAPKALEIAVSLGLGAVSHNPFMNNIAQLVECVHVVEDSKRIIEELLDTKWGEARLKVTPRAGRGVSAVEVPRGILYHAYEFDDKGVLVKSDCVIPTGQNHANIHFDLRSLAAEYARMKYKDRDLELLASMLVRSYDPCISCSVH